MKPAIKIETVDWDAGEELVLTRKTVRKHAVPAYSRIGGNMEYQTKEKSYPNLFAVLKDLSKNGTWFFWTLTEKRNIKTNVAIVKAENAAESRRITQAYQELSSLDIVKRIKQQHYLMNPKVMLPDTEEYPAVKTHWESL